MGSVLEFTDVDGLIRRVLVLDARYRTVSVFGQGNKTPPLPQYNYLNSNGNSYISGVFGKSTYQLSDTRLNHLYCSNNYDRNTSKYNCDVWMTYKGVSDNYNNNNIVAVTGVPAVEHCRNIKIEIGALTVSCDLPNINILRRIYVERNYIDRLDKSADAYNKYALGYRNPVGDFSFEGCKNLTGGTGYSVWSSTEYITIDNIPYSFFVNSKGLSQYVNRNAFIRGVIPVLELD